MEIDEKLREATQRNAEAMSGSNVFVAIFSENMVKEVIPILQMGLAVYLDKPIGLLVPNGTKIPNNLRLMAGKAIEYFTKGNTQSMEDATTRLMVTLAKRI